MLQDVGQCARSRVPRLLLHMRLHPSRRRGGRRRRQRLSHSVQHAQAACEEATGVKRPPAV